MAEDKATRSRSTHVALRSLLAEAEALRETARGRLAQCRQMADDMGLILDAAAPEPDYEALGYPETQAWSLSAYDLDILAYQSTTWRDLFLTLCTELATDKEYDTTSIRVDDKATD